MATVKSEVHGAPDSDLITGAELSRVLGVTREAVSKAARNESGRLDVWEDSQGRPRFHAATASRQWLERKAANKVTTTTRGQAAAGFDHETAKAVAHLPLTNPAKIPAAALKTWDPTKGPLDLTQVDGEKRELAQSRAEKERHAARLLQVKVWEKEGELVSKSAFYQKAYTLAAAIKDKLNGIPPQLGPQVVAMLEEVLVTSGQTPEAARAILVACTAEHRVRELLRGGITAALRDISAKPMEELIRG